MAIQRRTIIYEARQPLSTANLLNDLFPGPFALTPTPLSSRAFIPIAGQFEVEYLAGSRGFGANPQFVFGTTQTPDLWQAIACGLNGTTDKYALSTTNLSATDVTNLAGQALTVSFTNGDIAKGPIATSSLNAGGLLYAVNDTGVIDPGGVATATYKVLTVGGGGDVLTYQITDAGSGYVPATGVDTDTSGTGTGFKVNILTVSQGNGSAIITVPYRIVRV